MHIGFIDFYAIYNLRKAFSEIINLMFDGH